MIAVGIVVATLVAFVVSSAFYAVVPGVSAPAAGSATDRPTPRQIVVELLRSALTASLVAGLLTAAGWSGFLAGALLGVVLWTLPVVLLAGSVNWEGVPVRTAAGHAADWLIKLVAIGAVVGAFG